jgi:hypothetical protein
MPLSNDNESLSEHPLFAQCEFRQEDTTYWIKSSCILQGELPKLEIKEVTDLLRDDIIGRSEVYQPFEMNYHYYGSSPAFASDSASILDESITSQQTLTTLAQQGKEISFSKEELARYWAKQLAFYVSKKDISHLSRCNTQNYTLALQRIDGYLLKPGDSFNANRELAKIRGYCTGRGEKNFLFYGGVCGMTAQFFRTSIIHPDIAIIQRHPHNERFVQYYGEHAGGDDAAIYELSKQFEIQNTGDHDIYFKVKRLGTSTQLVAISPRTTQRVEITKHPISELKIDLERTIRATEKAEAKISSPLPFPTISLPKTNQLVSTETFSSTYLRKNYETR